jgi:cation transporter-like permease
MLVGLAVATAAELAADKIPGVDHGLSLLGTVTRPLAGALAAGAVFAHVDPGVAALAGLIIGVPTALAVHGVQTSARLASTATTAGLGNPVLSLAEDAASGLLAVLAIVAPVIAAIAVVVLLVVGARVLMRLRRTMTGRQDRRA